VKAAYVRSQRGAAFTHGTDTYLIDAGSPLLGRVPPPSAPGDRVPLPPGDRVLTTCLKAGRWMLLCANGETRGAGDAGVGWLPAAGVCVSGCSSRRELVDDWPRSESDKRSSVTASFS